MYAILFWEDSTFTVISLKTIVSPRKEIGDYVVGEAVKATFRGKLYSAHIYEISDDRSLLNRQLKSGMKLDLTRLHILDSSESEISDKESCPPQSLAVSNDTEKTSKKRHKSANELLKTKNFKKQRKSADKPISNNTTEKSSEIQASDPLVEQAMQILQKRRALVNSTDLTAIPASPITAQNDIIGTTSRLSPSLTQLTTRPATAYIESSAFQSEEPMINEFGYMPAGPVNSSLARNCNMSAENSLSSVENSTAHDSNTTAELYSASPVQQAPTLALSNTTPARNTPTPAETYIFPDETSVTPSGNTPTTAENSTSSSMNNTTPDVSATLSWNTPTSRINTLSAWNTQTHFRNSTAPAQTTSTPARTILSAWNTQTHAEICNSPAETSTTPARNTLPPAGYFTTPNWKTQTPAPNMYMSLLDSSFENEQVSGKCHSCSLLIKGLESRVGDLEAQVKAMQNKGAGSLGTTITPTQTPLMPRVLQYSSKIQQKENAINGASTEAIVADSIQYETRLPKALSKAMRAVFSQHQLATCSFKGGITSKGAPRPGLPEVERDIIIDVMARQFGVDTSTVEGKMRSALNRFCKAYSGLSPL